MSEVGQPLLHQAASRQKSDVRDAAWIAECTMKDLIRGSFVPDEIVQRMRQYNRRILTWTRRRSINWPNWMPCFNVAISVSATTYLLQTVRATKMWWNCFPKELSMRKADGGHPWTDGEPCRKRSNYSRSDRSCQWSGHRPDTPVPGGNPYGWQASERVPGKLTEICRKEFPREFDNLQTIPGVKERSATSILSELGADMKMFITAAALVSWCGLKPRNEESAGKSNHEESHMVTSTSERLWLNAHGEPAGHKTVLLEFQLHTNCRQKEECHESESGHSAENACCHLARVEWWCSIQWL